MTLRESFCYLVTSRERFQKKQSSKGVLSPGDLKGKVSEESGFKRGVVVGHGFCHLAAQREKCWSQKALNEGSGVSGLVSYLDFHSSFCSQMTGVWYEIARTRFTFNTMESVISIYEYNSDMDHLDGLFTGTLEYCSFCDLLEKKCASQCNDRGSHLTMEVALSREMQVRTVRLCLRTMPDRHIWCQFR